MSVFKLGKEPVFPDPLMAGADGLLAIGGDLTRSRLLAAYSHGIFPWYSAQTPIMWWSPDPRPVIIPSQVHVGRRLQRTVRNSLFTVTFDAAFESVIAHCAFTERADGDGTWLVPEMIDAYIDLHRAGYAHSVEVWAEEVLVAGLYGVALGRAYFGESMFTHVNNGSKLGFVHLCARLAARGYHFIDCQQATPHMVRFGAVEVHRSMFLARLNRALTEPTEYGSWSGEGVSEAELAAVF